MTSDAGTRLLLGSFKKALNLSAVSLSDYKLDGGKYE
jgi:hypothetical protein